MSNKKALVFLSYPEPFMAQMVEAFKKSDYEVALVNPQDSNGKEQALVHLSDATVALIGMPLPASALEGAPKLKWVHFDWVGVEGFLSPKLLEGRIVTNGSGRNSICLSEHVFFFIFALAYGAKEIFESQQSHKWGVDHAYPYLSLYSRTIVIAGTGSIAQEIAIRAKAFGMRTIGLARSKKDLPMFDEQYVSSETTLESLAGRADYMVSALSLNKDTYHMFNAAVFKAMKPTAYLINISRGAVIDEDALAEALRDKTIAGAGCDTFTKEPLDSSSPLWDFKQMIITPHSTPQSPLKFEMGVENVLSNLELFEADKPLNHQQRLQDMLKD